MQRALLGALLCASAAVVVSAPRPAEQRPVFRASTRLVQVSVVVQDGRGQAVPGLTAADFEIRENGKIQAVSHFALHASAPPRRAEATSAGPGATPVFTNVLEGRVGTGATILLFDQLNTPFADQGHAIKHIVRFLERLQPTDRIGFYILEAGGVRVVQDFSRDVSGLLALLKRFRANVSQETLMAESRAPGVQGGGGGDVEHQIYSALAASGEAAIKAHARQSQQTTTVEALEALALRLAGVQGRKNVVWVTSGIPLALRDAGMSKDPNVYRASLILSTANISIYPVDARGLIGAMTTGPAGQVSFVSGDMGFGTASIIAEQTGGRSFRNTNDLATAMKSAAEDANVTYELGYYPTDENWDRRFRRISVKVARKDVSVRHRSGYFGHAPRTNDRSTDAGALLTAIGRPLELTAVGVTVDVARAERPNQVALTVRVDPATLTLVQEGDISRGAIELVIAHVTTGNALLGSVHTTLPLDLTPDQRRQFAEEGLRLTRTVTLADDARQLIVGVRDVRSGAMGTVRIDAARLRTLLHPQGRPPLADRVTTSHNVEFHNQFSMNLHHTLYAAAWARRPEAGTLRARAGALPSPLSAPLTPDEQKIWDEAVAFYDKELASRDLLFDARLSDIKHHFARGDRSTYTLASEHEAILQRVAPVYVRHYWPAHDKANQAWIDATVAKMKTAAPGMIKEIERLYGVPWFTSPVRVDAVWVGNRQGGYTTVNPAHAVISTSDPEHKEWASVEIVFHELSHQTVLPLQEEINKALGADAKQHRDLWHVVQFYLTGAAVQRTLKARGIEYTPYLYSTGLFDRAWGQYRPAVEQVWSQYVEGKITRAEAIGRTVRALRGQ